MNKRFKIFFCVCFFSTAPLISSGQENYIVEVHKGTELLHIVNYLAGVYVPAERSSSYVKAVDDWFSKYRTHPAVEFAKKLPYNDFSDLGWCVNFPSLEVTYPDKYGYFGDIIDKKVLKEYLRLSAGFAKTSKFADFYQSQQNNYTKWESQFKSALQEQKPLEKLADFYQHHLEQKIYFSISPMGVVLRANIYQEDISPENKEYAPVIIPFDNRFTGDDYSEPNFAFEKTALNNNVWHEVSHLFWEELNEPFREEIMALTYEDSLSVNFKTFKNENQNRYFFIHEIVADAVTIFLKMKYIGNEQAMTHLKINESYGSPLYREIVELIEAEYWENRKAVRFREFIPQIVQLIDRK